MKPCARCKKEPRLSYGRHCRSCHNKLSRERSRLLFEGFKHSEKQTEGRREKKVNGLFTSDRVDVDSSLAQEFGGKISSRKKRHKQSKREFASIHHTSRWRNNLLCETI